MEDINDIKLMWQDLNSRLSYLEDENKRLMRKVMQTDYHSTKDKLIRKYAAFIGVESIMIVFVTLFFIFNPEVNDKFRWAAMIYWDAFFLIEVLFDGYLMLQLRNIDVYTSSIKEIAQRSASNWKLHKIGILVGLPLAFGAIFLFALALNANEFTILGMIVGGTIGLIIGINQLLKFKGYYKFLQTEP